MFHRKAFERKVAEVRVVHYSLDAILELGNIEIHWQPKFASRELQISKHLSKMNIIEGLNRFHFDNYLGVDKKVNSMATLKLHLSRALRFNTPAREPL